MKITSHKSELFNLCKTSQVEQIDWYGTKAYIKQEFIPFFEWITEEMASQGIDWKSYNNLSLHKFLKQVVDYSERSILDNKPSVAAKSETSIKISAGTEVLEPVEPIENPQKPKTVPIQEIPKIWRTGAPEQLTSTMVDLCKDTKSFVAAVFIFMYWYQEGVAPTLEEIKEFLRSEGLIKGEERKVEGTWNIVNKLAHVYMVIDLVKDEEGKSIGRRNILPILGAMGAEDPWAILSYLLDSGEVSEEQIIEASKSPMNIDAERQILSKLRHVKK